MAADSIQLRAPAKINLSFRVLGRRADGFHEIETLMAPVSLSDELTITRTDDEQVHLWCDDATLPTGDNNLVVKAARLFFRATGAAGGARLELRKRIPHGAGLGGGSSDAASTLLGLNELFSAGLPTARLYELAAELGSDVPFFIAGSAARCTGRGEKVDLVSLSAELSLLLLKPPFSVPTSWAYSRWRDAEALSAIAYGPQQFSGLDLVNDLERPVFEKHLFLATAKMWLLKQPEVAAAVMSGSGSTVFAVLTCADEAEPLSTRARAELDPHLWTAVVNTAVAAR